MCSWLLHKLAAHVQLSCYCHMQCVKCKLLRQLFAYAGVDYPDVSLVLQVITTRGLRPSTVVVVADHFAVN